jgi:hypothetical protein
MGRSLSGSGTYSGGGTGTTATPDVSQTLTDAANIDWNISKGNIATVTLSGNRVINNPTNLKVGGVSLFVRQDSVGNRSVTSWGSIFHWPEKVPPQLSTAANAVDMISGVCDGTNIWVSYVRNM